MPRHLRTGTTQQYLAILRTIIRKLNIYFIHNLSAIVFISIILEVNNFRIIIILVRTYVVSGMNVPFDLYS